MTGPVVAEMLAAPVVVVLEVRAADLADPARDADGYLRRTGTLRLEVVEVVKGRLSVHAGDVVDLDVDLGPAALWPSTDPGSRWVAFCDASTIDLRGLLTLEHCHRLAPADRVLDDVHLVRTVQRRHPTADRLLAEAWDRRATAGDVFARYVWVAVRDAVRGSLARFDALLRIAEDAGTRVAAQEAYLLAAYEDLTFAGPPSPAHRDRLAVAMARSALDPHLGELRTVLLGTYLPGLVAGADPADVLGDVPGLRDALRAELADPRDPATASPTLLAWLDGAGPDGRG